MPKAVARVAIALPTRPNPMMPSLVRRRPQPGRGELRVEPRLGRRVHRADDDDLRLHAAPPAQQPEAERGRRGSLSISRWTVASSKGSVDAISMPKPASPT